MRRGCICRFHSACAASVANRPGLDVALRMILGDADLGGNSLLNIQRTTIGRASSIEERYPLIEEELPSWICRPFSLIGGSSRSTMQIPGSNTIWRQAPVQSGRLVNY